ncbi:hypothetical protein SNK03_003059 [Fusarium graminearum]
MICYHGQAIGFVNDTLCIIAVEKGFFDLRKSKKENRIDLEINSDKTRQLPSTNTKNEAFNVKAPGPKLTRINRDEPTSGSKKMRMLCDRHRPFTHRMRACPIPASDKMSSK